MTDAGIDRSGSWLTRRWPWLAYGAGLGFVVWAYWRDPPFSPDSWVYYALSRSIWSDFYHVTYLRSFVSDSAYSSAFPPLWPLLWSVMDKLTGLGAQGGLAVAALAVAATGWVSERIGRALAGRPWLGLCAWLVTLLHRGLWREFTAARSIPLSLLLMGTLLLVSPHLARRKDAAGVASGVLLGLMVLTRFDLALFAVAFTIGLYVVTRSWKRLAFHVAALLATLSPWIAYSWMRFGTLFSSDTGAAVWLTDPDAYVTDWYPPGLHMQTFHDAPLAWIAKVLRHLVEFPLAFLGSPDVLGIIGLLLLVAGLVLYRGPLRAVLRDWRQYRNATWTWFALVYVCLLVTLPQYIILDIYDGRYFAGLFWLTCLALVVALALAVERTEGEPMLARRVSAGLAVLFVIVMIPRAIAARVSPGEDVFPQVAQYPALRKCLDALQASPRGRILASSHMLAGRLAAVHGLWTTSFPRNLLQQRLDGRATAQFLRQYSLRFAAGDSVIIEAGIPAGLRTRYPHNCGLALYRLAWQSR